VKARVDERVGFYIDHAFDDSVLCRFENGLSANFLADEKKKRLQENEAVPLLNLGKTQSKWRKSLIRQFGSTPSVNGANTFSR
jgi:hypothetical protein